MKRTLATLSIVLILGPAERSWSFLDQLIGPPAEKKQSQGQGQGKGQEQRAEPKGLIEGLGGMLGAKEKDLGLIKKGLKAVQSLQPIGVEEEIAIGQAVAIEAFSRFGGEYIDDKLAAYINLVGKTVAEVSDRPELTYRFAVLNSPEQNAFAAPGGYIFVTIGLLKTLKNEAELAGVLAHEVAHVTQKHMLKTLQRSSILANVTEFSMSAMNKDPQLFSNVIDATTDMLFEKGLDKELEFEADTYGIEYAYRAGYHPNGFRDYLATLQSQEGVADSRFFSTHPSTSERLRRAQDIAARYTGASKFPYLTERFRTRMGKA
jgi:predicted Zn-dependent protease